LATFWHLTPPYRNTPAAETFATLKATFAARGELINADPLCRTARVTTGRAAFYVKCYTGGGKKLRRWIGRSRVRAEWENLLFFERLGIPIPPVVAYGQETRLGHFRYGALVTAEVPNTCDLSVMHEQDHPLLADRQWLESASRQIADYTRRLHQNRFGHRALKWRNILVTLSDTPQIYFIDCPAGQIRRGPGSRRWFLKDIACLDKVAKKRLSRTQRLRFYMAYEHLRRLKHKDKQKIRKILRFFEGRE